MKTLILKLGATGDVVRTTPLLRRLEGEVIWVTSAKNRVFLDGLEGASCSLRVLTWEQSGELEGGQFDLAINLEDDLETAAILNRVRCERVFGAYANGQGQMAYSEDARAWFDLSLISVHGREQADRLKYANRRTYQDLIFSGLGWTFEGESYLLPPTPASPLQGDVAIAPEAGAVWPMKKWAYYGALQSELERRGYRVNVLPTRPTLLEHLADVRGHRCVVNGDSLPMHLAMGSGIPCVALFTCTSPWEIYEYGLLTKIVSPVLGDYFYKRGFEERATTSIPLEEVLPKVLAQLG